MEPASSNSTFNSDSSWKVPPNSNILMRASQVSTEYKQGDQSYLRLTLGQFFGQRSEALGCLGSADDLDFVKRVSTIFFFPCVVTQIMSLVSVSLGIDFKTIKNVFIHKPIDEMCIHIDMQLLFDLAADVVLVVFLLTLCQVNTL